MNPSRETRFQAEEIEWHWLRPHMERGAVIVVHPSLDPAEAAARIAADDASAVSAWIAQGLLTKPDLPQIETWNADPARLFHMLIVQPWVLVQEFSPSRKGDPR